MANKVSLSTINADHASVNKLNTNFDRIETGFNNTLSLDGTVPNSMEAVLDMNSNRIINLPEPVDNSDAARLQDVRDIAGELVAGSDPTKADVDLSNVVGGDFADLDFLAGTGTVPFDLSTRFSRHWVDPEDFGAVSGGTDCTSAFQAALNTGKNLLIQANKTYYISGQLTMNTNGQNVVGISRWTSTLRFTYAAGPQIVINTSTVTQLQSIRFYNLCLYAHDNGNTLCWMKWVRGLEFNTCRILADQFLKLGDETMNAVTQNSYICNIINCELNQIGGTKTFMDCYNFAGQFLWVNSFLDGVGALGTATTGVHGFSTKNNVRVRVDNIYLFGGIIHRFDNNLDFEDGRIVNGYISNMQLDEAKNNGIRFNVTSTASGKADGSVGYEGFVISNVRVDAKNGPAIYIGLNKSLGNDCGQIDISNLEVTGATSSTTPIVIDCPLSSPANPIKHITITNVSGYCKATTSNQDFIKVVGATGGSAIRNILIDNIDVSFNSTSAGRSVVRFEGSNISNVSHGGTIIGKNATLRVDDQSGLVCRNGWFYASDTNSYGSISAGSTSTRAVTVNGAAVGDHVTLTQTAGSLAVGVYATAKVTSANTVTITISNNTSGSSTPGSCTFLVRVKPTDL